MVYIYLHRCYGNSLFFSWCYACEMSSKPFVFLQELHSKDVTNDNGVLGIMWGTTINATEEKSWRALSSFAVWLMKHLVQKMTPTASVKKSSSWWARRTDRIEHKMLIDHWVNNEGWFPSKKKLRSAEDRSSDVLKRLRCHIWYLFSFIFLKKCFLVFNILGSRTMDDSSCESDVSSTSSDQYQRYLARCYLWRLSMVLEQLLWIWRLLLRQLILLITDYLVIAFNLLWACTRTSNLRRRATRWWKWACCQTSATRI